MRSRSTVILPARTSKARRVLFVAVVAFVLYCVWQFFGLHVSEPARPLTPAQAQVILPATLPVEARNIGAAEYRQWIEFAQYARFEAPLPVCLGYAKLVVPGAALQPVGEFQLERDARPLRSEVFRDFSWFDLQTASNMIGSGGGSNQPEVWIDQDRGVFYYRKTD